MDHHYSQFNSFNDNMSYIIYEEEVGETDMENTIVSSCPSISSTRKSG